MFTDLMEMSARFFEIVGVFALFAGLLWAAVVGTRAAIKPEGSGLRAFREIFGGAILLALEVLVAADLIRTVAIAPSVENVTVLAVIVIIRTVLSFSLETEIEGVPPWKRAAVTGGQQVAKSTSRHW